MISILVISISYRSIIELNVSGWPTPGIRVRMPDGTIGVALKIPRRRINPPPRLYFLLDINFVFIVR